MSLAELCRQAFCDWISKLCGRPTNSDWKKKCIQPRDVNSDLRWYHWLAIRVLRMGRVPRHIAMIMDGNRRYAKHFNIPRMEGHLKGYETMMKTVGWCLDIGISELTVYAFSIENFKRTQEEVDGLMFLLREKCTGWLNGQEQRRLHDVRVRFIGNLTLLPEDLQGLVAKIMLQTRHNRKLTLNVALCYTARDEITHSMRTVLEGISGGLLEPADVSEELLTRCLYTERSPAPEVLLRTSDVRRLSDFMLWQTTSTVVHFVQNVRWPALTIWHLLLVILQYQRQYKNVATFPCSGSVVENGQESRVRAFLLRKELSEGKQ